MPEPEPVDALPAPSGHLDPDAPAAADASSQIAEPDPLKASSGRMVYRPALEGIRGFLLFGVIFAHMLEFLLGRRDRWTFSGFGTVTMFFVLTGYLVTGIVVNRFTRHGDVGFRPFVKRRLVRLGPPLLLFVAADTLTVWLTGGAFFSPPGSKVLGLVWTNVLILVGLLNFVPSFGYYQRFDSVQMWTLGVDLQFYLLWPVCLVFLLRRVKTTKVLVWSIIGLALVVQVTRVLEYQLIRGGPLWVGAVYQRPENNLDPFLFGAALYVLWSRDLIPWDLVRKWWPPFAAVFLVGTVVVVVASAVPYYGGYLAACICSFVLLAEILHEGSLLERIFSLYWLRVMGRVSYTAYVWHLYVFLWFNHFVKRDLWWAWHVLAASVVLAVVVYVAWYVSERPFQSLPPLRETREA